MYSEQKVFYSYVNYLGIKNHFNIDKFIFNPNNVNYSKINIESFRKRKDKYFFERLTKKQLGNLVNIQEKLISSFLYKKNIWIGDIVDNEDLETYHFKRLKNKSALTRTIQQDLFNLEEYLVDNRLRLKSILNSINNQKPELINISNKLNITLETISLFSYVLKFTDTKTDNIIYEEDRKKIIKYSYLIKEEYNMDILKPKLKEIILL